MDGMHTIPTQAASRGSMAASAREAQLRASLAAAERALLNARSAVMPLWCTDAAVWKRDNARHVKRCMDALASTRAVLDAHLEEVGTAEPQAAAARPAAYRCKHRVMAETLRDRVRHGQVLTPAEMINLSLQLAEVSDQLAAARGGNLIVVQPHRGAPTGARRS